MTAINQNDEAPLDINQTDDYGNSLARAAIRNDLALARMLIGKNADLEIANWAGNTALMLAVANNHPDFVHLLLRAGADIDHRNNMHATALDWSKSKQCDDIEQILNAEIFRRRAAEEAAANENARRETVAGKQEALGIKALRHKPKIRMAP